MESAAKLKLSIPASVEGSVESSITTSKGRMYRDITEFITKQRSMVEEEQRVEVEEREKIVKESSSTDLQELGLAVNRLKLKSVKGGLYGRTLLTFAHPNYSASTLASAPLQKMLRLPESKLSTGDNVTIFKHAASFDGAPPLERGVILKKTEYKYVVALNNADDLNEAAMHNEFISLVMEANHVTYDRYLRCLDSLAAAEKNINTFPGSQLLKVLLDGSDPSNINPHVKAAHRLSKPITNYFKKDMNLEQKDAISFCLSTQTVGLIHGPPGTGKTMTVCELIYQAVQMGMKVLACAGSNIAVDNIVERLARTDLKVMRVGHPARMLPQIYEQCLDHKLRKTTCYKELKTLKQNVNRQLDKLSKESNYKEKKEIKRVLTELRKEMREQEDLSVKEVVQETQVVCCTNTGAGDSMFKKHFSNQQFDLVVIDECAQALELSCWIPILQGKRVILAGDHKQLPPTIKSRNEGLSVTLFDRVLQEFEPSQVSRLLKVQYRMNKQIMDWSSKAVYEDQLQAHDSVANHSIHGSESGGSILLFIDTAGAKMGETLTESTSDKNRSKSNVGEADLVKVIFDELKLQGILETDIGVITPYNAQVDLIKKLFESALNPSSLEVSTVDGFQGREKDCIIISMVRSNPIKQVGFLNDYRRMNVAVTRARKFVCLIGDSETVSSDPFLKDMVTYFSEVGEVRSAMEYVGMEDVHFNIGFIEGKKDATKRTVEEATKKVKSTSSTSTATAKDAKKKNKKDGETKGEIGGEKPQASSVKITTFDTSEGSKKAPLFSEDTLKTEYSRDISMFLLAKDAELKYEKLNSFQRRVLHELAEFFGLEHESIGVETLKDMVLRKKPGMPSGHEKAASTSSSSSSKPAGILSSKKEDANEDDDDEEVEADAKVTATTTEDKKKKKKKKNKGAAAATTGIVIGSSLTEKSAEGVKEVKSPAVTLSGAPSVASAGTTQPLSEADQYKEYILKKQQEQKDKEAAAAAKAQREAEAKAAAKKNKAKDKKAGKPPATDPADEMDDLAFLAALAEEKKYCKYMFDNGKKCGVYIEMLGSNCKFCDSRYCIRHGLQETHGCGDKVKKEAREQFEKSFMMQHRGEKNLRPDQVDAIQHKLSDKIKSTIDGRKTKKPEKDQKK